MAFGRALLRWCFLREVELAMAAVLTPKTPRVLHNHDRHPPEIPESAWLAARLG